MKDISSAHSSRRPSPPDRANRDAPPRELLLRTRQCKAVKLYAMRVCQCRAVKLDTKAPVRSRLEYSVVTALKIGGSSRPFLYCSYTTPLDHARAYSTICPFYFSALGPNKLPCPFLFCNYLQHFGGWLLGILQMCNLSLVTEINKLASISYEIFCYSQLETG